MTVEPDSILLVLPVPFRRDRGGRLLVEEQAGNGLDRWAENFRRLVVAGPVQPTAAGGGPGAGYVGADRLAARDRIEFVPLPWAYRLGAFARSYRRTRAVLAAKVRACDYLCFAIGGLVGDWSSVAALEAVRQGRRFAVWTDRVEHQVVKHSYADRRGLKRAFYFLRDRLVVSGLMKRLERHLIRRCDLGLFHGRDCFDAYAPYCRDPHLVHNVHLKPEDRIGPERLGRKLDRIRAGGPLRLVYAGRAAGMKGPLDWVRVMADLRARGVPFSAAWIGDGPLLPAMRDEAARLNLGPQVAFPGHVGDRARLLEAVRDADLFVYCHKTPESPRCLIEALMSASPPLGYDSPYSRDLVGDLAGRLSVARDDTAGLADRVAHFAGHRAELAEVVRGCDRLGEKFSDREVFQHRSDLIKDHLGPTCVP